MTRSAYTNGYATLTVTSALLKQYFALTVDQKTICGRPRRGREGNIKMDYKCVVNLDSDKVL